MAPDVDVLIYVHCEQSPEHEAHARWLGTTVTGPETFALSELTVTTRACGPDD